MERTDKMEKLHNSFNSKNLIIYFKGSTEYIDFNDFIDTETRFNYIKDKIWNEIKFKSKLSSTRVGSNKSGKQLSTIENITKFYQSWKEVIL